MLTEQEIKNRLKKTELELQQFKKNFKGWKGNDYYNKITFLENVIMVLKHVLEDEK